MKKEYNSTFPDSSIAQSYEYDTAYRLGILSDSEGNEVFRFSGDIARKINTLLYISERINRFFTGNNNNDYVDSSLLRRQSNCHITANYIAGIDSCIGKIGEYKDNKRINWDNGIFENEVELLGNFEEGKLGEVVEEYGFPLLCRVGKAHSIIVLGKNHRGEIIGFEQKNLGGNWLFCNVNESISHYRTGKTKIFFGKIPN